VWCGMAILNERTDMWPFSTERLTFLVSLDFCASYLLSFCFNNTMG
jgi:hypothetical protein